jgi:hypothetical protein
MLLVSILDDLSILHQETFLKTTKVTTAGSVTSSIAEAVQALFFFG